jgi:DNA-directed RNA polymerase specialized sigma24 family protein
MDLSHREVAERMGISEKTVENHLTRALARITEALVADTRAVEADIAEPSVRRTDADRGID